MGVPRLKWMAIAKIIKMGEVANNTRQATIRLAAPLSTSMHRKDCVDPTISEQVAAEFALRQDLVD